VPRLDDVAALKFLIHLIGDIHQPLHTGLAEDYGGNAIKANFPGTAFDNQWGWDLHRIWDSGFIDLMVEQDIKTSGLNKADRLTAMADQLLGVVQANWCTNASSWARTIDPAIWAQETLDVATRVAYRYPNGTSIEWYPGDREVFDFTPEGTYAALMAPTGAVNQQLAKAGVRLAATLNSIWPDRASLRGSVPWKINSSQGPRNLMSI
jgi:hypothetical protein